MSNSVTSLCRPLQVSPAQKAVLMCIADRADDSGLAWPSIPGICEWTCLSRTAVIVAMRDLTAQGMLSVEKATGKNNRCRLDLETIELRRGDPCATRTRAADAPVRQTHPTRAADAPAPVRDAHPTRAADAPEASESINQAPVQASRTGRAQKTSPHDLLPEVDVQTLADWLVVRKAKKAGDITKTVADATRREAARAGISPQEAVEKACEFGWQAFIAKWYLERIAKAGDGSGSAGYVESFKERDTRIAEERVFAMTGGLMGRKPGQSGATPKVVTSPNPMEVLDGLTRIAS